MGAAGIVGQQVLVMFLLIAVGFTARKKNIMTDEAARSFCGLLISVAYPCMLISSLYRPLDPEKFSGLALAFGLGVALHVLAIAISRLVIARRPGEEWRIERFGAVYSNCGFMAFPIIRAAVGEDGVFFAVMFGVTFAISQWTHGTLEMGDTFRARSLLLNPGVLSALVGLAIYFLEIRLPVPLADAISLLGGVNTPLSMVITGVFLANVQAAYLKNIRVIWTSVLRVALLPAAAVVGVWAVGLPFWFEMAPKVCLSVLIGFACPSAVATILFSARLKKDVHYATAIVTMSTLMSLATLPLMTALAEYLFY
jgi:predicted permease